MYLSQNRYLRLFFICLLIFRPAFDFGHFQSLKYNKKRRKPLGTGINWISLCYKIPVISNCDIHYNFFFLKNMTDLCLSVTSGETFDRRFC